MKIGILYDSIDRAGLDCSRPDLGNPGIGGTEYCFLMLIYYFKKNFPGNEIFVYEHKKLNHSVKMPLENEIHYQKAAGMKECCLLAKKDGVDFLLFNVFNVLELSPIISELNLSSIVWIHNWIRGRHLKIASDNPNIKRAVFLVKEHYDRYIDDSIIKKSVFIPNMFNAENCPDRVLPKTKEVTFVGALVPVKGFGLLAKVWPKVIKKVPEAQLNVIGAGNLYGEDVEAGPLGIADKNFEEKFIKYICDEKGNLLPSVHLLGLMGAEKVEIFKSTRVGIVNPSGRTEVCPISALEMEAMGIPTVSRRTNGLPDVIKDKETGRLIRSENELVKAIVDLLNDDKMNRSYSEQAKKFIEANFNPAQISKQWFDMFSKVVSNEPAEVLEVASNYSNNLKWLRVFNAKVKKIPAFKKLPSLIRIEGTISKLLRGN